MDSAAIDFGIRRLVVELPREQHRLLKMEAADRGISLKQLAIERLAPRVERSAEPAALPSA